MAKNALNVGIYFFETVFIKQFFIDFQNNMHFFMTQILGQPVAVVSWFDKSCQLCSTEMRYRTDMASVGIARIVKHV